MYTQRTKDLTETVIIPEEAPGVAPGTDETTGTSTEATTTPAVGGGGGGGGDDPPGKDSGGIGTFGWSLEDDLLYKNMLKNQAATNAAHDAYIKYESAFQDRLAAEIKAGAAEAAEINRQKVRKSGRLKHG